ncbi:MAG: hypothetical protein P8N02_20070 [Actinomycetota bacterium]|jgi:hypothetical protein|nr:hypothetical protein [Actinomycetota bacterium]
MVSPSGTPIQRARAPWVSRVTADAIRHFAWGIGDDNPLWHDPTHPLRSTAEGRLAPGCLLYAVEETTVAPGHTGLRRLYRSVDWTWFDILSEGTLVTAEPGLLAETPTSAGLEQSGRVEFRNDRNELLALAETTTLRTDEPAMAIDDRPELRYSGEEIDAIEQRILAEEHRGDEIRYWEDVTPGELLPPVTKGPLSIMDVVAWVTGTQGVAGSADEYGEGGLHEQTATGPQQVAWLAQAVTSWMSDEGFLHRLSARLHSNPPLGSTTTVNGAVTSVDRSDAGPVVHVELKSHDQSGVLTAEATATVMLPSREHGPVALPIAG